ncbi:MAG: L-rhamnose isomerase, partial [Clostridiales bacterium]|nr:L-rhamnose isomerase [Clostridiales bacterium]
AKLQDEGDFTKLMVLQEELKLYPVGDVWNYYCKINNVPQREDWFNEIKEYEENVLSKR